jgi:hypothetical protein
MSSKTDGNGSAACRRIEEFIFVRELNEVFLLLDHISGRWDKSLYNNHNHGDGEPNITELCKIAMSPPADEKKRVEQAVHLLCAKDKLNAAARPATGLTIAFTLLVVGEDNQRDARGWLSTALQWARSLKAKAGWSAEPAVATPSDHQVVDASPGATPPERRTSDAAPAPTPFADKPTRLALARYAFPGLVKAAERFNMRVRWIVRILCLFLVVTCLMSWHVTGGNAMLRQLDALEAQQASLFAAIEEAESKQAVAMAVDGAPVQFCREESGAKSQLYRSTGEYQLCTRRHDLEEQVNILRVNLRNWLGPWRRCYSWIASPFGQGAEAQAAPPGASKSEQEHYRHRAIEEQARIVTLVVGTSVLPLCYGILGAGAAVVRGMWAKMRESLLSPRDYTLALLQLALGATMGACIALFVNPSVPTIDGEIGLLAKSALSTSALSFIAGFGVEGVFVALESLVRRVFNITDPARRPIA